MTPTPDLDPATGLRRLADDIAYRAPLVPEPGQPREPAAIAEALAALQDLHRCAITGTTRHGSQGEAAPMRCYAAAAAELGCALSDVSFVLHLTGRQELESLAEYTLTHVHTTLADTVHALRQDADAFAARQQEISGTQSLPFDSPDALALASPAARAPDPAPGTDRDQARTLAALAGQFALQREDLSHPHQDLTSISSQISGLAVLLGEITEEVRARTADPDHSSEAQRRVVEVLASATVPAGSAAGALGQAYEQLAFLHCWAAHPPNPDLTDARFHADAVVAESLEAARAALTQSEQGLRTAALHFASPDTVRADAARSRSTTPNRANTAASVPTRTSGPVQTPSRPRRSR